MTRTITAMVLAAGVTAVAALAATASAQTSPGARTGAAGSELSAQKRSPRARTRIRVAPAYPYRTYSTTYPVPYAIEYPGPGFVRQCTSWLAPENRVSGPVVVPKMRCWWQPG